MSASPCARPSCGNRTTDPSGRCQWHRVSIGSKRYPVPGTPGLTAVPRYHPTGGYDDVERDRDRTTYTRDGKLHREDGPALVRRSHSEYYRHGNLHRTDGPAVESPRKSQWWVDGKLHRLDGPAWIKGAAGKFLVHGEESASIQTEETFYVYGEEFTAEEFVRVREALDDGAPYEWARSFAKGGES